MPSGLLPSRSVGPEPGMMSATGAFGPRSGDARVPWRTPEGPSMLSRVSVADAPAVAARMMTSIAAASFIDAQTSIRMFSTREDDARVVGHYHPHRCVFAPFRVSAKVRYPAPKASALFAVQLDGGLSMLVRALIVTATALAAFSFALAAHAQVVDFGKYPDFSGQWKRPDGVGIK